MSAPDRAVRLAVIQAHRLDLRILHAQINSPTSTPAADAVTLIQRHLNELEDRFGPSLEGIPTGAAGDGAQPGGEGAQL